MRTWLGPVAASAMCIAGAGTASATIVLDGSMFAGVAYQDSPQLIAGVVWSEVTLSYTNDWIKFHVTNNEYTLYVTVDALNDLANNPSFPNYKFRIAQGSLGGPVVLGPTTVSNLTTP